MLVNFFNKYFKIFLKYFKNHNILIKKISFLFIIAFSMLPIKLIMIHNISWQIDYQEAATSSMLSVVSFKILLFFFIFFTRLNFIFKLINRLEFRKLIKYFLKLAQTPRVFFAVSNPQSEDFNDDLHYTRTFHDERFPDRNFEEMRLEFETRLAEARGEVAPRFAELLPLDMSDLVGIPFPIVPVRNDRPPWYDGIDIAAIQAAHQAGGDHAAIEAARHVRHAILTARYGDQAGVQAALEAAREARLAANQAAHQAGDRAAWRAGYAAWRAILQADNRQAGDRPALEAANQVANQAVDQAADQANNGMLAPSLYNDGVLSFYEIECLCFFLFLLVFLYCFYLW